jgi:hypothetical protein
MHQFTLMTDHISKVFPGETQVRDKTARYQKRLVINYMPTFPNAGLFPFDNPPIST